MHFPLLSRSTMPFKRFHTITYLFKRKFFTFIFNFYKTRHLLCFSLKVPLLNYIKKERKKLKL